MLRTKFAIFSITLAMTLLPLSVLEAQNVNPVASAPLPSQIVTAKKVFISNAGGEFNTYIWSEDQFEPTTSFTRQSGAGDAMNSYPLPPTPTWFLKSVSPIR